MILYFLNYNNYYNRIVKKADNLNDYLDYALDNPLAGVSFNPGNGVGTTQVVNRPFESIGDYLVCVNEYQEIDSRWFIINAERLRTGQYALTLRRDLIADNYESITKAPAFIEKATLLPNDPMLMNKENMTYNQIKTSEIQLKDKTGCAWIVGYYGRDDGEGNTTTLSNSFSPAGAIADIQVSSLEQWEFHQYIDIRVYAAGTSNASFEESIGNGKLEYKINSDAFSTNHRGKITVTKETVSAVDTSSDFYGDININASNTNELISLFNSIDNKAIYESFVDDASQRPNLNIVTNSTMKKLQDLNNKIIKVGNDFYRIATNPLTHTTASIAYLYINPWNNFTQTRDLVASELALIGATGEDIAMRVAYGQNVSVYINLIPYDTPVGITYNITTNRYHLNDAPYDMFAIPYADDLVIKYGDHDILSNKQKAFEIAMNIAEKYYGAGWLYDIQLLPYCPIQSLEVINNTLTLPNDSKLYSLVTGLQQTPIAVIFNPTVSAFTFDINLDSPITLSDIPEDRKIQSECDLYRLVSPNYNGQFEFNAVKNGGVSYFNVDCSYKPFTPYIHINPNFANLYGVDFDDARGLICGGEFSLPIVTDAWQSYELTNKNYQNIFDRQIKNMEVINNLGNWQQGIGSMFGAVGTGLFTGAMTGNPIVGVAAGAASALGGMADLGFNIAKQNESIDYTKDLFGYQMGNIKAMSDSISRTSSFTYNNKIFPILEYYTCTETEKEALRNKLKYNGMTVMRIGTMEEFIREDRTYIKCQLIRFEDINSNTNICNEIAQELLKGVFI